MVLFGLLTHHQPPTADPAMFCKLSAMKLHRKASIKTEVSIIIQRFRLRFYMS